MFERQSGYILPDGFSVVSKVFDKVLDARHLSRYSEEGECLARQALTLYMSGIRGSLELEHQLSDVCRSDSYSDPSGPTTVVDLLPELTAWARGLTPSPEAATELTEQTLEHAIEHINESGATSEVRGWLFGLMLHLRFGRRPNSTRD